MSIDKRTRLNMIDYGTIGGTLVAGATFFPLVGIPFLIGGALARSYVSNNYNDVATNRSKKDGFFYRIFDGIGNIYNSIVHGYKNLKDKTKACINPEFISPQENQSEGSSEVEEQIDSGNSNQQYNCPFYAEANNYLENISRKIDSLENSLDSRNINISQPSSNNLESIIQNEDLLNEEVKNINVTEGDFYSTKDLEDKIYLQGYLDRIYRDSNLGSVKNVKYLVDKDGNGFSITRKVHLDKYTKNKKINDINYEYIDSIFNENGFTYKYKKTN